MHNTLKPSQPAHSLDLGLVGLSCYSEMGDYIGMESCVDLKLDYEAITTVHGAGSAMRHARRWETRRERREYPPPMPMVARGMRRYYTSDGRLIIREERIRRTECLRAHRANGRLILQLVPLDEDDEDDAVSVGGSLAQVDTEGTHDDNDSDGDGDRNHDDDGNGSGIGEGISPEAVGPETSAVVMGKCYGRLTSSSCMFGMPVAAVRPVHI